MPTESAIPLLSCIALTSALLKMAFIAKRKWYSNFISVVLTLALLKVVSKEYRRTIPLLSLLLCNMAE